MSAADPISRCPLTDAVLAQVLDGEPRALDLPALGGEWTRTWSPEEIAAHRGECDDCASALHRARRLDALVAGTATFEVEPETQARWFAFVRECHAAGPSEASAAIEIAPTSDRFDGLIAAGIAAESDEAAGPTRRPGTRRAVVARAVMAGVAVVVIGLVAWFAQGSRSDQREVGTRRDAPEFAKREGELRVATDAMPRSTASVASAAADRGPGFEDTDVVHAAPDGPVVDAPAATSPIVDVVAPRVRALPSGDLDSVWSTSRTTAAGPTRWVDVERLMLAGSFARASALGLPRSWSHLHVDAVASASALRMATFQRLLRDASGAGLASLAQQVLSWPADDLARVRTALGRARGEWPVRLAETARRERGVELDLVIGTGGGAVDAILGKRASADPRLAERIAASLAGFEVRPGRAALLVRVLLDRRARARSGEDEFEIVRRWFAPQPAACTRELIELLTASNHAAERRIALLAIAVRRDVAAEQTLFDVAASASLTDARLAAFALGLLPRGNGRVCDRQWKHESLRLAVLAARRDPALHRVLRHAGLRPHEVEFVLSGPFSEAEFDDVADLFRRHRIAAPSSIREVGLLND